MPNKPKKGQQTYGRGGGGGGWLQRLLGGGDTSVANQEIPEELKDILGEETGYITPKGKVVSTPYSDVRGFMARAAGAPNTAEQLNTEASQALLLQKLLNPGELSQAEQLSLIANLKGILRSDTEGVQAFRGKRLAEERAGEAKAGAEKEGAITKGMIEKQTRTPKVRTAQQIAQRGVNEETQRTLASSSGQGKQAIQGSYLAQQLAPIFNLWKAATVDVSPGEVSSFSSERLPDVLQKLLGPGFIARGTTFNEQPILGQPIGSSGMRPFLGMGRNTQPGEVLPVVPINPDRLNSFLGQGQQGTVPSSLGQPRATGQQFGPFLPAPPQINLGGVGMPSLGAGGSLSAPYNPPVPQETPEQAILRKQREAQQAQELLRRLLQQGTPYSPNTRNF